MSSSKSIYRSSLQEYLILKWLKSFTFEVNLDACSLVLPRIEWRKHWQYYYKTTNKYSLQSNCQSDNQTKTFTIKNLFSEIIREILLCLIIPHPHLIIGMAAKQSNKMPINPPVRRFQLKQVVPPKCTCRKQKRTACTLSWH